MTCKDPWPHHEGAFTPDEGLVGSDESQFTLNGQDGRRRCWRRQGEHCVSTPAVFKQAFGGGDETVLTKLPYILWMAQWKANTAWIMSSFLSLWPNTGLISSTFIRKWLLDTGVPQIKWPDLSSDLNPITSGISWFNRYRLVSLKRHELSRNTGSCT